MNLEVLEAYAQAKLSKYKLEQQVEQLKSDKIKLKEQLKDTKNKEQLKEYFTFYDENSVFINESMKKELIDFIIKDKDK